MSAAQVVWATALIVTLTMLPVGAVRMVVYRSRQIDHTPTHRFVAWLALGIGLAGLVVLVVMTVWFLGAGERPIGQP